MLAPPRPPEAKVTPVMISPSVVWKLPRSIENEPGPAKMVGPKKENVIVSKVGDTVAKEKEPETPIRLAQAGASWADPTQKPGLAGSVWRVGPPKGLIRVAGYR